MFPVLYATVTVHVSGQQPQVYKVPDKTAHDFAGGRYIHYRPQLGEFKGSRYEANTSTTFDRFEKGSIIIARG